MQKLSIVIPVYNEKNTLLEILELVKSADIGDFQKEIILVDDKSTDGSTAMLKKLQKENPEFKVYFQEKNEGKGAALKVGFSHTTGDYVIVQDADLEYDPHDYIKLLRALKEDNVDVVYGSRFSGNYEDMSNLHYFGNKIVTFITNILFGVMLTDMETCYKLFPGEFIRSIDIKSKRFNFEPEITAKILKSKLKFEEVPINYKGRSHSAGKKLTWRDGVAAVLTLIKFRFVN